MRKLPRLRLNLDGQFDIWTGCQWKHAGFFYFKRTFIVCRRGYIQAGDRLCP